MMAASHACGSQQQLDQTQSLYSPCTEPSRFPAIIGPQQHFDHQAANTFHGSPTFYPYVVEPYVNHVHTPPSTHNLSSPMAFHGVTGYGNDFQSCQVSSRYLNVRIQLMFELKGLPTITIPAEPLNAFTSNSTIYRMVRTYQSSPHRKRSIAESGIGRLVYR